jgi:D-arabinose 1-dehydrogenase-like Zn-dependent alcohol dehydrogenase
VRPLAQAENALHDLEAGRVIGRVVLAMDEGAD